MISKVLKSNLAYAIGSFANSAALFLLMPYLVNALTPEEYGAWSLLEIGTLFVRWIVLAGLDVGLMRRYWHLEGEEERARLVGTALVAALIWGALITGMSGSFLFARGGNWDFPGAPYTMGLTLAIGLLEAVFALLITVFRIREEVFTFVALSVGRMVAFMGLSIGLVQAGGGLPGALAGRLLAGTLGLGAAVVLGRAYLILRPDWAGLRRMAAYGLPLVPSNLASYVLFASDRYALQHFSTLEMVGIYSFAYKVGAILDILMIRPFALDWAPRRFKIARSDDAPQKYAHVLVIFLYAGLLLALSIMAVTPVIYTWIAPPLYSQGMSVVPVILAAYLIYGLGYPLNIGIMLLDKTKYAPLVSGAAAALCIGLNLWWIPRHGMIGAAWATLLAYMVRTGGLALISLRLYPVPYPMRSILVVGVGAFLGYAGLVGVGEVIPGNEMLGLSIKLAWVLLVFAAVAYGLLRQAALPATFWPCRREEAGPIR